MKSAFVGLLLPTLISYCGAQTQADIDSLISHLRVLDTTETSVLWADAIREFNFFEIGPVDLSTSQATDRLETMLTRDFRLATNWRTIGTDKESSFDGEDFNHNFIFDLISNSNTKHQIKCDYRFSYSLSNRASKATLVKSLLWGNGAYKHSYLSSESMKEDKSRECSYATINIGVPIMLRTYSLSSQKNHVPFADFLIGDHCVIQVCIIPPVATDSLSHLLYESGVLNTIFTLSDRNNLRPHHDGDANYTETTPTQPNILDSLISGLRYLNRYSDYKTRLTSFNSKWSNDFEVQDFCSPTSVHQFDSALKSCYRLDETRRLAMDNKSGLFKAPECSFSIFQVVTDDSTGDTDCRLRFNWSSFYLQHLKPMGRTLEPSRWAYGEEGRQFSELANGYPVGMTVYYSPDKPRKVSGIEFHFGTGLELSIRLPHQKRTLKETISIFRKWGIVEILNYCRSRFAQTE